MSGFSSQVMKQTDAQRFEKLVTKIHSYNRAFDPQKLSEALNWAAVRLKSPKTGIIHDELSEGRILVALKLAEYIKADSETILASVLYTAMRPLPGKRVDENALKSIEEKFGKGTRILVEDTLRLDALEYLRLDKSIERQSEAEHRKLFNLMGMEAARQKRAIAIRATANSVILDAIRLTGTREQKEHYSWMADNVVGPLSYLAGYDFLYTVVKDRSFLVKNPGRYTEIKRGQAQFNKEEIAEIITRIIEERVGLDKRFFTVKVRPKGAASTDEKATRKKQDIAQLGDRHGFKIILKPEITIKDDVVTLEEVTRTDIAGSCHQVFRALTREAGRGSRDEAIREKFACLRYIDPHDDDKKFREMILKFYTMGPGKSLIEHATTEEQKSARQKVHDDYYQALNTLLTLSYRKDARRDNYYRNPKESGYLSMQDTFFINYHGKLIEFEGQVVDENADRVNTYAEIVGHVYYKTGLEWYSDIVSEWRKASDEAANGNEIRSRNVFVFTRGNGIVHGRAKDENGFTVADLAKKLGVGKTQGRRAIAHAYVDNDDPLSGRGRAVPMKPGDPMILSASARLRSGDRVLGFVDNRGRPLIARAPS